MEEEIAKSLSALEQGSSGEDAQMLRLTYLAAAEKVEFTTSAGDVQTYVIVRIPYRSLPFYKKVSTLVIDHLEDKLQQTVIVVANRKIQSLNRKCPASSPRSWQFYERAKT